MVAVRGPRDYATGSLECPYALNNLLVDITYITLLMEKILRKDWLELRARWLPRWKRRCTVLHETKLMFYHEDPTENLQAKVDCSFPLVDITAVEHESDTILCLTVQFGARILFVQCYTKERTSDWYRELCYHGLKKDK
jgi:hypothetical protein